MCRNVGRVSAHDQLFDLARRVRAFFVSGEDNYCSFGLSTTGVDIAVDKRLQNSAKRLLRWVSTPCPVNKQQSRCHVEGIHRGCPAEWWRPPLQQLR